MHTTKKHQEHKPTANIANTTLKLERNKRTRNQTTYHKQEKNYFSSKHGDRYQNSKKWNNFDIILSFMPSLLFDEQRHHMPIN